MINKTFFLLARVIIYSLLIINCNAQGGAAINATGSAADNSAMLDVSSTNQGMRIPRVALTSTTSAAPVTNPANSLLVYDSVTTGDVTPGFYYWDATKWVRIATGSGGWSTSGNAGTDTTTNFIGTTDDRSWVMKTNSTERMKISKTGNVGIGTSNPASSAILDVSSTTKGMRMPNMTTSQRDAIVSPVTGLQIYNTDCNEVNSYNGSCWLPVNVPLGDPGLITTDVTAFCANTSHTYSIDAIPNATKYVWSVPPGASVTSGQGSTSATVLFGNISGDVCVYAYNACESSPVRCVSVNVDPIPVTPGSISGTIGIIPGQAASVVYSITVVQGASAVYSWTVPPNATIFSGQGTTTITVIYPCNALSGNVSVTATAQSGCGTSPASTLAITVTPVIAADAGSGFFGGTIIGGSPTASAGKSPYTYLWSPVTNLSSSTVSNPTAVCAGSTTTYIVRVTDANSCTATNSVVVTRNLTATAAGANPTFSCSSSATFTLGGSPVASGGTAPYTYAWNSSPFDNLSSTNVDHPTAPINSNNTYSLTVTDANTCTASNSMVLSVPNTNTFNFTGALQTFIIPAGITCVRIEAWGAGPGGLGGYINGVKTVAPGNVLNIYAGGTNGYNGGGTGGGTGGGASDVRIGGTALGNRIIVGGGAGGSGGYAGGSGGYPAGGNGQTCASGPGMGGTQSAGGAGGCTTGSLGTGGNSGGCGGAGGGGYYGGGGACTGCCGPSGGGGSSYFGGMNGSTGYYINGINSGNGKVVITY
ncbi:MAG: hypothetical protein HGB12_07340 [Bacteroidetes bacterium]|nr:hypothetical protein [Bacteroidota bacterium]